MSDPVSFPRPALTVDLVVLHGAPGAGRVLLVRRGADPFAGSWALPGGFVEEYEDVAAAAVRELAEETGITLAVPPDRIVGVYGEPGRDPRGWTVSVVYLVELGAGGDAPAARGGDDAAETRWWPVDALPELAFDHARILAEALELAV